MFLTVQTIFFDFLKSQYNFISQYDVLSILLFCYALYLMVSSKTFKVRLQSLLMIIFFVALILLQSGILNYISLSVMRLLLYVSCSVILTTYFLQNRLHWHKVQQSYCLFMVGFSVCYIFLFTLFNFTESLSLHWLKVFPSGEFNRIALLLDEPVDVGIYLVFALVLMYQNSVPNLLKFITLIAAICTFSMGALILLSSLGLYIYAPRKLSVRAMFMLLFMSILVMGIVFLNYDRVSTIFSVSDGSTRIRLALMIAGLAMALDNPLGVGWGNGSELLLSYLGLLGSSVWMENVGFTSFWVLLAAELGFLSVLSISIYFIFVIFKYKERNLNITILYIVIFGFISAKVIMPLTLIIIINFYILQRRNKNEEVSC